MSLFEPGNKKGNRFKKGQSGNPAGKPKGTLNLMTIVKEIALKVDKTTGQSNLVTLLANAVEANRNHKKALEHIDEKDPKYRTASQKYQDSCQSLADHLIKCSGDYTTNQKITDDGDKERRFSELTIVDGRKIIKLR